MRRVVAALGMSGAQEERIHRLDQRDVVGVKNSAALDVGIGCSRFIFRADPPRMNVLRTVAVCLGDVDLKHSAVGCGQRAVDANASLRGELHHDDSDRLILGKPVQRVADGKHVAQRQSRGRGRRQEARWSDQRGSPQAPVAIARSDGGERCVRQEMQVHRRAARREPSSGATGRLLPRLRPVVARQARRCENQRPRY